MSDRGSRPSISRVMFGRRFAPIFFGNLLSNSGTWFQNIAQALLIYRLTNSTFLVGVVNFAQFAAIIFLFSFAGRAADHFDRRKLLITTQAIAVLITGLLAALTYADLVSAPIVVMFAFALGVTTAFFTPALQAVTPALVEPNEMRAAVALIGVTFNLARALGPVLGVLVVAHWGLATAFALNSLSYLGLIAGLLAVSPRQAERIPGPAPVKVSAFRLVRSDVLLAFPLVALGLVSFSSDPINTLTPAFSEQILSRPDTYAGILIGAFGAGAVIAAFVAPRWDPTGLTLLRTMALVFAGIFGFGISQTPATAIASLMVAGFGFLSAVTVATSRVHLRVSEGSRGRVMALWSVSFHGVRPFGSLADGALAATAGLRTAAIVMSLPALLGAAGGLVLRHRRRRHAAEGSDLP